MEEMKTSAITQPDETDLAMRYLKAEAFGSLYSRVMVFIENTASYLDGPGRARSKSLTPVSANDYMVITRQLTTGAMRIANTVLVLKAVRDGSMPFMRAISDIKGKGMTLSVEGPETLAGPLDGLPTELLALVTRCEDLRSEMERLVESLTAECRTTTNPVHDALSLISRTFGNA